MPKCVDCGTGAAVEAWTQTAELAVWRVRTPTLNCRAVAHPRPTHEVGDVRLGGDGEGAGTAPHHALHLRHLHRLQAHLPGTHWSASRQDSPRSDSNWMRPVQHQLADA